MTKGIRIKLAKGAGSKCLLAENVHKCYKQRMAYLVDEEAAARSRRRQSKDLAKRKARRDKIVASRSIKARQNPPKPKKVIEYQDDRPKYRPNMGKEFYRTDEWYKLRYKAIKLYGRVCACCGSEVKPFHVDHIKPRSKHPDLELELGNLQVLCEPCNLGKSNIDETDWRDA